jgi:glycosyltransferase involved in cell wall biosynthesis
MPAQDQIALSVVIPAFNEERRLAATLARVRDHLVDRWRAWEIVVVDDGSSDGTAAVAGSAAAADPRIVVRQEPHRGKGGAVKAGLLTARGAYRFMCDADLSMPIEELDRFQTPLAAGYDIAIGTREGHAARRFDEPAYRHWTGRAFNLAVQRLALPGIEDSQCGFKMFTASAVESIFPLVRVTGWAFDVEVLTIAREQRLRIAEVPIDWHYRRESQLSIVRDSAAMFTDVLRVRARALAGVYRRSARPARP